MKLYRSKDSKKTMISLILIIILAAFIIYSIWYMADTLKRTQDEETLAAAQRAIIKSAAQCYALEGQYPTGIRYLEENYGLTLNRDKYVYSYESMGANMVPVVNVYSLN